MNRFGLDRAKSHLEFRWIAWCFSGGRVEGQQSNLGRGYVEFELERDRPYCPSETVDSDEKAGSRFDVEVHRAGEAGATVIVSSYEV